MLPEQSLFVTFGIFTVLICVPMIIFCYILSIIKAIKDRRLIMMLQKQPKFHKVKTKRHPTGLSSGPSDLRNKKLEESRKIAEAEEFYKMDTQVVENNLATEELKDIKATEDPEDTTTKVSKERKEHTSSAEDKDRSLGHNNMSSSGAKGNSSNSGLTQSFTETDTEEGDWDKKCARDCGDVFGKCTLVGHKASVEHSHSIVPCHSKPVSYPVTANACCGHRHMQERPS